MSVPGHSLMPQGLNALLHSTLRAHTPMTLGSL